MKKELIALSLLSAIYANSQERSLLNSEYQLNSTSDQITVHTLSVTYNTHRRDLLWPYRNAQEKALDLSIGFTRTMGSVIDQQYRGNRMLVSSGLKKSNHLYFKASIGINNLENKTTTIPLYLINIHRFKYLFGEVRISRDLLYHNLSMPGSVTQKMSTQAIRLKETLTPTSYIKVPLNFSSSSLSDENKKNQYAIDLLFGKSYPIWIWMGIGYFKDTNQAPSSSYWSPRKIDGLGIRIDLAYSFKDIYHVGGLLNINRAQENNSEWFFNTYSSLFFKYGKRNDWQVILQWNHIASKRSSSSWHQNDFLINASLSL